MSALGIVGAVLAASEAAHGASAAELLEKGIYVEETKGELKAAGEIYQQVIDDPSAERSLLAQAQLRLGLCELKLGNKPRAISALERLTQEFPDKDKLLAMVGEHMPQLLDEMVKQIEQNYIQEVDRGELMETAIRAIIGKLDTRGGFLRTNDLEFLSTNALAEMNVVVEQKVAGIGAVLKIDEETQEVVVTTPLVDSPAFKGGLLADDRIVAIDGAELPPGTKLEPVIRKIRGPAGTPVTLRVKRDSAGELLEIKLVRDVVRLPSVLGYHRNADQRWEFMLDGQAKIGYVRLTYVGRQSVEDMRAAISELLTRRMQGLILDLRNNPGGLLSEAIAIADLFVADGRIVSVKGRTGEQSYDAKADGTLPSFPMVVLVNRLTASAAEIIAACLQDHGRAVVVGERTFGQGVVRSIIELKGGVGALKLPVAAYVRPNGKNMNRYPGSAETDDWGVRPDIGYEAAMTDDELKEYQKYLHALETLSNSQTVDQFPDRPLQKAIACLRAQLEQR